LRFRELEAEWSPSEGCFAFIFPRMCVVYQVLHPNQALDSFFGPPGSAANPVCISECPMGKKQSQIESSHLSQILT
jgi:hypothetical protein